MKIYAVMTVDNGDYPVCEGVALTKEGAEKLLAEVKESLFEGEARIIEFEAKDYINFYYDKDWYWDQEEPEVELFG